MPFILVDLWLHKALLGYTVNIPNYTLWTKKDSLEIHIYTDTKTNTISAVEVAGRYEQRRHLRAIKASDLEAYKQKRCDAPVEIKRNVKIKIENPIQNISIAIFYKIL